MAKKRTMNYARFINKLSTLRKPSPIRQTTEMILNKNDPKLISLAGGMPNASLFPFESIEIKASNNIDLKLSGKSLSTALQYCSSPGSPILRKWVLELQRTYQKPPILFSKEDPGYEFCVTNGSQDGLGRAFDMLFENGDSICVDNPCYSGTLSLLNPMPINMIPVDTDKNGMMSSRLRELLLNFETSEGRNFPKVLYTIPHCSNPTGVSASEERKMEIYKIAQEFDMLIIEDDPYYYLQFDEKKLPSYQTLDIDGRVLRLDSFSKVLSAGMRLGWISGPEPLIKRIILHMQSSSLHASSVTQTIAGSLLDCWQQDGFERHVKEVAAFYQNQCNAMLKSCEKWLTGLAEWNVPDGGMFIWIKVFGVDDTTRLIKQRAIANNVALLPGSVFEVVMGMSSSYVRASYSNATPENIDLGIKRFADVIKEELRSQS